MVMLETVERLVAPISGLTATASELNITDGGSTTARVLNVAYKARAYQSSAQSNLTNNTWTKITLTTENYDVGSRFASSTYTVPVNGYYLITGSIAFTNIVANKAYDAGIYIDGSLTNFSIMHGVDATQACVAVTTDIKYLTTNQTIELYGRSHSGGNTVDILANEGGTYLCVHMLSV